MTTVQAVFDAQSEFEIWKKKMSETSFTDAGHVLLVQRKVKSVSDANSIMLFHLSQALGDPASWEDVDLTLEISPELDSELKSFLNKIRAV